MESSQQNLDNSLNGVREVWIDETIPGLLIERENGKKKVLTISKNEANSLLEILRRNNNILNIMNIIRNNSVINLKKSKPDLG